MFSKVNSVQTGEVRPESQRRVPPDRGIILLDAKDRIGPKIWALYGKVERPVVLKDDLYVDNALNDFYRDLDGYPFLLLPYVAPETPEHYTVADAAYRRAVALGVTERPEIFFTCVYLFQLPEYRCVHIHADQPDEVLNEEKCLQLMAFEKLRLWDSLTNAQFSVAAGTKILPVTVEAVIPSAKPSTNLLFAVNSLALHHGYSANRLQAAWDQV